MRRKTLMRFATIALGFSLLLGGGMDANAKALSKEVTAYGTEEDISVEDQEPALIITSAKELEDFAENAGNYDGKLVQLGNDIKFNGVMGNYTPAEQFSGIFDGCGYTISGLYNNPTQNNTWTGLFEWINVGGVVKNVTIADSCFSSNNFSVGGIAAVNYGTILNCHVKNTEITSHSGDAGGIVGECSGTILNCSSNATVTGEDLVGGITGYGGTIMNCWNSGTVKTTSTASSTVEYGCAGGISGYNASTVQNCFNIGSVGGAYTGTGNKWYGGIVGCSYNGTVAYCYGTEDNSLVEKKINCNDPKNAYYTLSEMQSATFLNLLNNNRLDNTWFLWEIRSGSPYPQHRPLAHVKNCVATLSASTFTYNGNPQTPNVTVKSGSYTLVKDADYKLIYLNNVDAGKATVIVRGMNMFTGDKVLNYSIAKANPKISVKKKFTKAYGTQAFYLNANVTDGESSLSYSSASPKIATIDSSGLVTIKNTGVAQITISIPTSKNYNAGTVKTSILVQPKKQTAKLSVKGKKLSITWKKDKRATGYEVQYAFDKKFKKNCKKVTIKKSGTTSYKVKNMKKKKKYYVRVRAYKNVTINGKKQTLYGSWSTVKKISR